MERREWGLEVQTKSSSGVTRPYGEGGSVSRIPLTFGLNIPYPPLLVSIFENIFPNYPVSRKFFPKISRIPMNFYLNIPYPDNPS